ncbi:MAG TPA: YfhO family protein [Candidatus Saccharimonadales bacterium]|jgi:hypothetical protein|nr:YfhO family protein [Candidatus Saccharimonadales bacterium]
MSNRLTGPLIVVAAIFLANSLYLAHLTNPNPINTQSGLAVSSSQLVQGQDTIDPNDGTTTQALGHAAATQILHGHMPWWNYNEQVGAPLAGDMQSAALFPLTLILELSNGLLYFHIILEVIAGVATYYLLRKLGLRKVTSTVFGIAFGLNGAFAWFGSPNFNPIAFLPLLILGIEIAYDKAVNQQKRGWLLLALALALSLYAGFPEEAYLDGILAGLWLLARLIQLRHSVWRKLMLKVLAGGFVGLLLAAPILIAFIGYLHNAFIGDHAGLSNTALPYLSLPMLVFPYIYGPIYGIARYDPTGHLPIIWGNVGGYITLCLLFFGGMSVFGKHRRVLKVSLLIWIAILAARVYGFPGISYILNLIPGMSKVAIYRYVEPALEFAAIMLAAFGFERVTQAKRSINRQIYIVCALLVMICVILAVIASKQEHLLVAAPHHRLYMIVSLVWSLGSVALIAASILRHYKYRRLVCSAIIVADVMLMFIFPQLSAPSRTQVDTAPVSFLQTHLESYRMFSLGPIQPNYGSYYGIASIDTNNLPLSKNWTNYMTKYLDPAANPAAFSGVDPPSPGSLSPKDVFLKNLSSYEYVGVKYLVTFPSTLTPSEIQTVGLKSVFTSAAATIYQLPSPQPYFAVTGGACNIVSSDGKARVTLECSRSGQLLRRELYSPGWSVKSGSLPLSVKKNGSLFQAVEVPSGSHTLDFNYLPPHIYIGLFLFIFGWLLVGLAYLKTPMPSSWNSFVDLF